MVRINDIDKVEDVSLKDFCTIRIGGYAKHIFFPKNEEEVILLCREALNKGKKVIPLGLGSNVIFSDGVLTHFFIHSKNLKNLSIKQLGDDFYLDMGAGVSFKQIIEVVKKYNLEGFENLSGIPATIGGAVCMNAGAYGSEIMDVVERVYWVSEEGDSIEYSKEDISYSYRYSQFQEGGFIYRVIIKLKKSERDVKSLIKQHLLDRNKKQPLDLPTSGSTYKNPLPHYAGQLLEKHGFKGKRVGDVGFSEKHANFLVNYGNARFEDLLKLLEEAEKVIFDREGIELEREVRIIE
ncbi:MAG: UDP-N-acetylmuramate dehydrogenase [Hydrogenothermaceae bacterium]